MADCVNAEHEPVGHCFQCINNLTSASKALSEKIKFCLSKTGFKMQNHDLALNHMLRCICIYILRCIHAYFYWWEGITVSE